MLQKFEKNIYSIWNEVSQIWVISHETPGISKEGGQFFWHFKGANSFLPTCPYAYDSFLIFLWPPETPSTKHDQWTLLHIGSALGFGSTRKKTKGKSCITDTQFESFLRGAKHFVKNLRCVKVSAKKFLDFSPSGQKKI